MGAGATALGVAVLLFGRRWLSRLDGEAPHGHDRLEAEALTVAEA